MSISSFSLIRLEEELGQGHKWFVGPFLPPDHSNFSTSIEIGYVELQEVSHTDQYHMHLTTEEFYVIIRGGMRIMVEGSSIMVRTGEILLVRPGYAHIIEEVEPGTRILLLKAPPGPQDKVIIERERL